MGRVAYARIAPNEDLVQAVEKFSLAVGFRHAFVRGALGSLVDGCLTLDGSCLQIKGPAVEIVSLAGEVRSRDDGSLRASPTGVAADPEGHVYGGPFVPGSNFVCITLEEWLPAETAEVAQAQRTSSSPRSWIFRVMVLRPMPRR